MATLDANIAALLTETVTYAKKSGVDSYGQDTWGAGVALKCYPSFGSRMVQKKDGTVYTSHMSLYFDGNNATVQGFQLGDKFTTPGIAGGQTMEAQEISPDFSPGPSLNAAMSTWLVEVFM